MYSFFYKFVLSIVVVLCAYESLDYLFNNTPPNNDIAFMGMVIAVLLLIERLYIILWVESKVQIK